ncbi:MAG: acetyltransferase [bacterium]|nr:MAG: acetyltransferase [bacterium]
MIREAKVSDAEEILRLIRVWAEKGKLLHRSLNDIYESIRNFYIYENDGRMVGVLALQVVWEDIAEIRSLVVDEGYLSRGVGKALVERGLQTAVTIGVKKVFVLTYAPEYFKKLGFAEIDKATLPHKIWSDCVRCHKFPDCDETAVILNIDERVNKKI